MNLIAISFGLLVATVLDIVQLSPVPFTPLSKDELHKVALHCMDEVDIDQSVIEKVLKTEVLPRDDQKYKQFLACSYKKQGYLSQDGKEILYDNLFTFLEKWYDQADLGSLERCKMIRHEDAGELCYQNLDCILQGLRKIEMQKEIVSNDIEDE